MPHFLSLKELVVVIFYEMKRSNDIQSSWQRRQHIIFCLDVIQLILLNLFETIHGKLLPVIPLHGNIHWHRKHQDYVFVKGEYQSTLQIN